MTARGLRGRDDCVFFNKTATDPQVGKILEWLGGVGCSSGKPVEFRKLPEQNFDIDAGGSKGPVFLDEEQIELVHEPEVSDVKVHIDCDLEKILKAENERGAADPKWEGFWYGSEQGRRAFFRKFSYLWAFVKPETVKRKNGDFLHSAKRWATSKNFGLY